MDLKRDFFPGRYILDIVYDAVADIDHAWYTYAYSSYL
jgi:hypothetical protein